jgi:hypothetical protein
MTLLRNKTYVFAAAAAVVVVLSVLVAALIGAASREPLPRERGVWVWESPREMGPVAGEAALASAQEHGFSVVYVTIDDYLPIAQMPEGAAKAAEKAAYFESMRQFVVAAHARGLAVDALGGAPDWAKPENRHKGYALIDFVCAYNLANASSTLRGLQYDVEPYLLPEYEANKAPVLEEFVAFVDESVRRMQGIDAAFSIVIPHFYDSAQRWTPAITYKGKTAHAFTHLLEVMEQKQDSAIIVMAYRNFFEGDNGTRQLAEAEVKEANQKGAVRIIVAQETGNVPPDFVTFYGHSRAELEAALAAIHEAFDAYDSFGGVAVHYLDPFLELE